MNNTDNGWAKHWPDYLKAAFRGFTQPLESCTEALATFTTANCNIVLVPFKQHPAYHSALTHYPKGKCILAYTGFVSWSEPHYLLSDNAPSRMSEGQEGGGRGGWALSHDHWSWREPCMSQRWQQQQQQQPETKETWQTLPYLHCSDARLGLGDKLPFGVSKPLTGVEETLLLASDMGVTKPRAWPAFDARGHPDALRWEAYFPVTWPAPTQPGIGHLTWK